MIKLLLLLLLIKIKHTAKYTSEKYSLQEAMKAESSKGKAFYETKH